MENFLPLSQVEFRFGFKCSLWIFTQFFNFILRTFLAFPIFRFSADVIARHEVLLLLPLVLLPTKAKCVVIYRFYSNRTRIPSPFNHHPLPHHLSIQRVPWLIEWPYLYGQRLCLICTH